LAASRYRIEVWTGGDTSPAVMLSPKATIFVPFRRGTRLTLTRKVHCAVRAALSVAVHATVVDPIGNCAPDGTVHDTATGDVPPVACGGAYSTTAGPSTAPDCTSAGHAITGAAGGGGGVGPFGLEHETAAISVSTASASLLMGRGCCTTGGKGPGPGRPRRWICVKGYAARQAQSRLARSSVWSRPPAARQADFPASAG
jgi:hypothetical protein